MTAPIRPIAAVDVPLPVLRQQIADLVERQRVDVSVDRLRWLLAHPEAAADGKPCSDGEAAEYRHLLIDANADDATRPFVDLRKGRKL